MNLRKFVSNQDGNKRGVLIWVVLATAMIGVFGEHYGIMEIMNVAKVSIAVMAVFYWTDFALWWKYDSNVTAKEINKREARN